MHVDDVSAHDASRTPIEQYSATIVALLRIPEGRRDRVTGNHGVCTPFKNDIGIHARIDGVPGERKF